MAEPTNEERVVRSISIDGYAAKINNRVITRGDVREAMAPILPGLYRSYQGDELERELKKAYDRTLENLIERKLILEAFKKRGGQIPEQYVEDEIARIVKDRFQGDEARFEQELASQKKTRSEYEKTIREQMATGMMIAEVVGKRVRITPSQVLDAYRKDKEKYRIPEKIKFSEIVINAGSTPEERTVKRKVAEKALTRLRAGEDFSGVAKEVSEGGYAEEGGAFPWMQPKDVRPELRQIVKNLPVGKISDLIETDDAFYVLRVDARRHAAYEPFDKVRAAIKTDLVQKERDRLRKQWIEILKKNNYVVVY